MNPGAIVMLFIGVVVLYGALAYLLTIAMKKNKEGAKEGQEE